MKDVGTVELGAETYGSQLRFQGIDAVGFGVTQLPSANALDVERGVRAELDRLALHFPPGLKYQVAFNTTQVVAESIREVLITLAEAIALVVLVMFLFLQSWRSTLIPTITIPVSLIGAFAFVKLMDFSINTLTLFGIILATGIVVDDAIVVIENIERHIQEYRTPAKQAASDAMREVFGAVIATALVLVAVFVPVAFFPGTTGRLYAQFSMTIAFSVALSAFNALTLTPALSALLLDRGHHGKGVFFSRVERVISSGTNAYVSVLTRLLPAAVGGGARVRGLPRSDLVDVPHRPAGVRAGRGSGLLHQHRAGARGGVAAVHRRDCAAGGADPPEGSGCPGGVLGDGVQLQRRGAEPGADLREPEAVRRARRGGAFRPDRDPTASAASSRRSAARTCSPRCPRRSPASARSAGSSSRCSTRAAPTSTRWPTPRTRWRARATSRRGCAGCSPPSPSTIRSSRSRSIATGPWRSGCRSARSRARCRSISARSTSTTSTSTTAPTACTCRPTRRSAPSRAALKQFYVRNRKGQMIPLESVVRVSETTAPQVISHFNLFRSATINGSAAPGFSSGQALQEMEDLAGRTLPQGMSYAWSGLSLEESKAGRQSFLIFGLALLLVYLTLAAQYESLVLPFIVLLGVPLAVLGALGGAVGARVCQRRLLPDRPGHADRAGGQELDPDRRVRRAAAPQGRVGRRGGGAGRAHPAAADSDDVAGLHPRRAAARLRLRRGRGGRNSVGTAVAGGMLVSTFLNLVFIPVLYVVVQTIRGGGARRNRKRPANWFRSRRPSGRPSIDRQVGNEAGGRPARRIRCLSPRTTRQTGPKTCGILDTLLNCVVRCPVYFL